MQRVGEKAFAETRRQHSDKQQFALPERTGPHHRGRRPQAPRLYCYTIPQERLERPIKSFCFPPCPAPARGQECQGGIIPRRGVRFMAEIICIIGNKGGTGSTTLSHMLCQGWGCSANARPASSPTPREPLQPGRAPLCNGGCAHSRGARQGPRSCAASRAGWRHRRRRQSHRETTAGFTALPASCCCPSRVPRGHPHRDQGPEMFPRAYAVPLAMADQRLARDAADRIAYELMADYRHRIPKTGQRLVGMGSCCSSARVPDTCRPHWPTRARSRPSARHPELRNTASRLAGGDRRQPDRTQWLGTARTELAQHH